MMQEIESGMPSERIVSPRRINFEMSDGTTMHQIEPGSLLYDDECDETVRIPKRTCFAAVMLLFSGIALLVTSLSFFVEGKDGSKQFAIPGAIAFIPGAYASFQLYGAYRRWPGYTFGLVPSYENSY